MVEFEHMSRSLRAKLIVAFLATVLIPLGGTALFGNWITSRALRDQALDNARADLGLRAEQMEGYLANLGENVRFLSRLDSLESVLAEKPPSQEALARLQRDFASFAGTHADIFQTRYIDETGMEIVRVETRDGTLSILPAARLQNKAHRYYFAEAMTLDPGEVLITPLDLNREQGELQVPYIPTIRYATPVQRPDGSPGGIIILNLDAAPLLAFARADTDSTNGLLLSVVDENGFYLSHADTSRLWGGPRDLNTGEGAFKDYPAAWPQTGNADSGIFPLQPESRWDQIADAILPPGELFQANAQRRVLVTQIVQPDDDGLRLYLLADQPYSGIFASISSFRLTAMAILALAGLVATGMALSLASRLGDPILGLTEDVRTFVRSKLGVQIEERQGDPFRSRDEIQTLTRAFEQMSRAIDDHLKQLARLNLAGHHIAARLKRPEVFQAAWFSIRELLPAEYMTLSLQGQDAFTAGDDRWQAHRKEEIIRAVLDETGTGSTWYTTAILQQDAAIGYLCCAPICVGAALGMIELYGSSPDLGQTASGELLATLATQISISLDNADLYERLAQRGAELQMLVKQLISAQEEERRMVAYDLHDGLIQMLVGARLQLSNFRAESAPATHSSQESLRKGIEELGAAILEARRVIEGLRPATLDDLGLVSALRQLAEETRKGCGCELEFAARPQQMRLPPTVETTAFRIAQEAITNARKYAQTPKLRVSLALEADCLRLEVRDWGKGFRYPIPETARREARGVGIMGMRERAHLLGGDCTIESRSGNGTTVKASLPLMQEGVAFD